MDKQDEESERKNRYGTIEFAKNMMDEKRDKRKRTFCPLARCTCTEGCICYIKPEIINQGSDDKPVWDCKGGSCTAYMLVGPT